MTTKKETTKFSFPYFLLLDPLNPWSEIREGKSEFRMLSRIRNTISDADLSFFHFLSLGCKIH